jgi:hypothetical protein
VPEHRVRQALHVVRPHVVAAVDRRVRARRAEQRERRARAGAEVERVVLARRATEPDDVARDLVLDVHRGERGREAHELGGVHDGRQRVEGRALLEAPQHLDLAILGRIADLEAHEEAVELRLRQRERALELDRVLRREDDERRRQPARVALDGDRALLHRLEQRRLRARRRAVHLVGEHDVREQRARPELELAALLREEVDADDVGRHQVGRELDAVERRADRRGEGPRHGRLAGPRDVLEQDVPAAQQRDEHQRDGLVGADDHAAHVLADAPRRLLDGRDLGAQRPASDRFLHVPLTLVTSRRQWRPTESSRIARGGSAGGQPTTAIDSTSIA